MKALMRNHILQAEIIEVRGPNLLLTNGYLVDQSGATSRFDRLLISARELEPIEFTDESEEQLYQEAASYNETPLLTERERHLRRFRINFKKLTLPRTSQIIEYQVYEMDPFTPSKEKLQEVVEVGDDYLITKGANDPVKAFVIYAVKSKPYRKSLDIVSIEVI